MARRRVGVVLLIPEPHRSELQGLRRAVGDGALDRIAPHLTLVPPVNVRDDRMADAVRVLRDGAATIDDALRLTLGPPATFLPVNPVLHLGVGGDLDGLHALRQRVFVPPLERDLTWPFVPHVTLADDADEDRILAAMEALADYRVEVAIGAVHLLEEQDRRWVPVAEARFEPRRVVARGGLEVELAVAAVLDPEAARFARWEWDRHDAVEYGTAAGPGTPLVVVARRSGHVVGVARGELHPHLGAAHLSELIVAATERGTGVGGQLVAAVEAESRQVGCTRITVHADPATPAARFYRERGFIVEADLPAWKFGRDFVRLVRLLPRP